MNPVRRRWLPLLAGLCLLTLRWSACGQVDPRSPLLILDVKAAKQKEPYALRTSRDPFKETKAPVPSRAGLDRLNASGSASFSEESLPKIKATIGVKNITVVDLRQEAHGFIDGLSVCWWSERNASNKGKTLAQVEADETARLNALRKAGKLTVYQAKIDDAKKTIEATPVTLKPRSIASEEEVCKANQLGYVRIPVTDREKPDNVEVDRFIRLVRTLPEGHWLHFHCKAGNGRTTTFLAMYDMMRNAKKVSLNDIIHRQALLGGADLFDDPARDSWRYEGAVTRRKFLEQFYQYCKTNNDGFEKSWSEWLAQQGK